MSISVCWFSAGVEREGWIMREGVSYQEFSGAHLFALPLWVSWVKPSWLSKLVFGGPIAQVEVLKVEVLDIRSKPLREKLRVVSSLSIVYCFGRMGFGVRWCLSLSLPIFMWVSFSYSPNV